MIFILILNFFVLKIDLNKFGYFLWGQGGEELFWDIIKKMNTIRNENFI